MSNLNVYLQFYPLEMCCVTFLLVISSTHKPTKQKYDWDSLANKSLSTWELAVQTE